MLGNGVSPHNVAIFDVQLQHLHVVDGKHLVQNRLGFRQSVHTHLVLLQNVQLRVGLEQRQIHVSTSQRCSQPRLPKIDAVLLQHGNLFTSESLLH